MSTLAGARIVTPLGVLDPGWIRTDGELITHVAAGPPSRAAQAELSGKLVVPGFVDIHAHGGDGASFQSDNPEDVCRAAAFHLHRGTTTMLASLTTAPWEMLESAVSCLADLCEEGLIAGTHLEGPFLNELRRGAHRHAFLREPTQPDIERLFNAGRGTVRMVTLAPELVSGLEAVRHVSSLGATAAIGHTDATYDVAREAIDAGVRIATHLYNGMRPVHHRAPGPVAALLEDNRVTIELINDGIHLHPSMVGMVVAAAGPHRVALISDASPAAGLDDGTYLFGDTPIDVEDGVAQSSDHTSLAGSMITSHHAFRAAALTHGVQAAVAMASSTPAKALDLKGVGEIAPGNYADLVVLDSELTVVGVMKRGHWVEGGIP